MSLIPIPLDDFCRICDELAYKEVEVNGKQVPLCQRHYKSYKGKQRAESVLAEYVRRLRIQAGLNK